MACAPPSPYVGISVRPNMLNIPAAAADFQQNCRLQQYCRCWHWMWRRRAGAWGSIVRRPPTCRNTAAAAAAACGLTSYANNIIITSCIPSNSRRCADPEIWVRASSRGSTSASASPTASSFNFFRACWACSVEQRLPQTGHDTGDRIDSHVTFWPAAKAHITCRHIIEFTWCSTDFLAFEGWELSTLYCTSWTSRIATLLTLRHRRKITFEHECVSVLLRARRLVTCLFKMHR